MQNFFFKKCLFEYENQFAVEKKKQKIFGDNFKNTSKNFCRRHQKNASHTIFINRNCMVSIFFIPFFSCFFMKRYQFRYQNNYKIPLKFD